MTLKPILLFFFFRLSDLYESVENQGPGVRFTGIQPPVIGRGGKKGDIYQLVRGGHVLVVSRPGTEHRLLQDIAQ